MSADKYPSIFSHQMETIVYISLDFPPVFAGHIQTRDAFIPIACER